MRFPTPLLRELFLGDYVGNAMNHNGGDLFGPAQSPKPHQEAKKTFKQQATQAPLDLETLKGFFPTSQPLFPCKRLSIRCQLVLCPSMIIA